ncbi:hypothetical protein RHSIM_Rhsim03G0122900 [Rhododendron simsii]|uniref:Uncharacterized protein n=1 Tax=Rhododendron simsii TaxID=118357 RepID=A0A834H4Q5_RHOSS|nr:hypothetical protein RHSIM_Rhsim03G0122900 [Rhododendron simsii]
MGILGCVAERGVDICFPTPLKENRDTQRRAGENRDTESRIERLSELAFGVYSLVVPVPLMRGGMVVPVPFRRWVHVKHRNPQTLHGGFYCLLPIRGQRVIAAVARYRHGGQLEYKAYSIFVREYRDVLGLGDNLIWAARDDLVKWLDALVHNSFVHYSTPGSYIKKEFDSDMSG